MNLGCTHYSTGLSCIYLLQAQDALKLGGVEFVTKYVMYFLHERLWAWLPAIL
jgi:uncharacterized membrane protein